MARGQFLPPSAWVIAGIVEWRCLLFGLEIAGVVEWRCLLFGLEICILSALDFPSNFPDFFPGCNADGGGDDNDSVDDYYYNYNINTLKEVNSLPLKTGFDPRPITVEFVVDKLAQVQAQAQVPVRVFLLARHFTVQFMF